MKRNDSEEYYWKRRYEKLCTELQALHEQVNQFDIDVETKRVWELPTFIYVSYNYDVVDTEEVAKERWGDNYDIFRHWKSLDGEEPNHEL